jgi:predicted nuclease with TOPRIM domain
VVGAERIEINLIIRLKIIVSLYHHTVEMQQMMEHLLANMDANQAEVNAMQQTMDTNEAKVDANLKEFKGIKINPAKMDIHQEKMEAAIHSIRSELEETIKH